MGVFRLAPGRIIPNDFRRLAYCIGDASGDGAAPVISTGAAVRVVGTRAGQDGTSGLASFV